jgi:hypothetical protein
MAKKAKTPSNKPKFDVQQFLLEKGDRVGLAVAGVGLALMVLLGLMAASRAASSATLAGDLEQRTQSIQARLVESPDPPPAIPKIEGSVVFDTVKANQFVTANPWFNPGGSITEKRSNPIILPVAQTHVRYALGGIGEHMIQEGPPMSIAILQGRQAPAGNNIAQIRRFQKGKGGNPPANAPQPPPAAAPAPVPGQPLPGMAPGGPGGMAKGKAGGPGGALPEDAELSWMSVEDPNINTAELAVNIRPFRGLIVAGVVPYKKQVSQYLSALQLPNDEALVADDSAPLYSGFDVERQVLASDGKTVIRVNDMEWAPFDHAGAYRLYYRTAADVQQENPRYAEFVPEDKHKLYLYAFKMKRGSVDPLRLTMLDQALDEMAKTNQPAKNLSAKQKQLTDDDNIFAPQIQTGPPGGAPPGAGKGGIPMEAGRRGPGKGMPIGTGYGAQQQPRNTATPVWICQFLDPTVEPGKTYRYRIRLKAVNPNLGRKDAVAFPGLASVRELESEWSEGTEPVTVPQEEFLFAEGDRFKDKDSLGTVLYDTTTLRYHKWQDYARTARGSQDPVADWVIADIEARRGQYVRQERDFRLPLWSVNARDYIFRDRISMPNKKTMAELRRQENVRVQFDAKLPVVQENLEIRQEPVILVNFEGGKGPYRLPNGTSMTDESAAEILLMADDGRTMLLQARNTATDRARADKQAREQTWVQWLDEVRNRTAQRAPGG